MSTLKVNTLTNVAGNADIGNVGKILQVKQTVKTDTASSSSSSFVDFGPTVAITPSSSSNKVLVRFTLVGFSNSANYAYYFRLGRNGSAISGSVGDSSGDRTPASTVIDTYGGGDIAYIQTSFEFLDSPATTSATTYSIQFKRSKGAAGTFYLNRNNTDLNNGESGRFPSVITAMEVAA